MMPRMRDDFYYDCPECGHTMLLSPDQVGGSVECPDCRTELRIPDIREGVNPRIRSRESGGVKPERVPPKGVADSGDRLETLEEGLRNLTLKNNTRIEQMALMQKSAELLRRQLGLLDSKSPGPSGRRDAAEAPPPPNTVFWGTLTLGLCLATLLTAAVAAAVVF